VGGREGRRAVRAGEVDGHAGRRLEEGAGEVKQGWRSEAEGSRFLYAAAGDGDVGAGRKDQ
jgi:hypothetical protein